MNYNYEAFTRDGKKVYGNITAESEKEAITQLHNQDLIADRIIPEGRRKNNRISSMDLITFTNLLSTAVGAHIPLIKALGIILEEYSGKSQLRSITLSLIKELEAGRPFSEALSLYKNIFSNFYINMVRTGEKSGKLDKSLDYILKYLQKRYDIAGKLSQALLYPSFIMCFAIVVLTFFITFLIPRFQESYSHFGSEIPAFTMGLIRITGYIKNNIAAIILFFIAIFFSLRLWIRTKNGRVFYDRFILIIPFFGNLRKKEIVSLISRSLSILLMNGVTLKESLELTGDIVNNSIFKKILGNSVKEISSGRSFAASLKESRYIPEMLVQITAMGEESGNLPILLDSITEFYEKDLQASMEKITTLISPLLIIFIGIIIGIIVVALFLPIFNISEIVK